MCLFFVSACAPSPVRIQPTSASALAPPEFVTADPQIALPALVAAERQAASERNLPLLATLWAQESRIVDSRNTPDASDDYVWSGHRELMDRYVVAVFPHPPAPFAAPPEFDVSLNGDEATAQLGQDRWRFVWQEGRWWLRELVIAPATP